MEKSTTDLTIEYIKEHPHIKHCLKLGIINYSSLSRLISKELGLGKKSSMEAILVAARRFKEKLTHEVQNERKIKELLSKSEIEIKNKMSVLVISKSSDLSIVEGIQDKARKESSAFFLLEGSESYTILLQEKYAETIMKSLRSRIIKFHKELALVKFKSPGEIEETVGVVSYLATLFSENNVNIIEFLSCWRDTLLIINSRDVNKAIMLLDF